MGLSDFNYENIDDGSAKKFYLGYRPNDKHFAFEVASIDSGDADIQDVFDFDALQVDGFNISGVYNTAKEFGKEEPFNVFIKLGYYSVDTELSTTVDSITESSSGLSFGIGLEYALTDYFSLGADLEGLLDVEDFDDDETVTFMTVGAKLHF